VGERRLRAGGSASLPLFLPSRHPPARFHLPAPPTPHTFLPHFSPHTLGVRVDCVIGAHERRGVHPSLPQDAAQHHWDGPFERVLALDLHLHLSFRERLRGRGVREGWERGHGT
jgi:hypothetical protein